MDSMSSMPLTPDGEELDDYMDFFNSSVLNKRKIDTVSIDNFDDGVCFNCKGEAQESNLLLRDSYQVQEYLHNLLIIGAPSLFNGSEKNIFGRRVCLSELHCKITHYFMVLRKNINLLEDQSKLVMAFSNYNGRKSSYEIRKDIANFFLLLSTHLKTVEVENQDFRILVITEILDLLRFLNPFCSSSQYLTGISSPLGNQCSSGFYHYFHAQLDIRWWALCILHQIDAGAVVNKMPDDVEPLVSTENAAALSAFDSSASFVAWDIIFLMHKQIMNMDCLENSKVQHFSCTCVHELSSSLLHILDNRAKIFKKKGFWDLLKDKLLILMEMAQSPDRKLIPVIANCPLFSFDLCPKISLIQVWCIFIELAKLYNWTAKGLLVSDRAGAVQAEPRMLKTLIKLSLNDVSQKPSEAEVRFYLQSCLVLMDLWQKDKNCKGSEWIAVIWEFMIKYLNSCFFSRKTTLEGFSNQRKSPEGWFKQLNELDSDPNSTGKNDTSWQIFLKLIVGQLNSHGNWKVLQGRIYSKFHEKRMLELNSNGIYNTVSLFLTIGLHGDLFVLCNKLLDLLAFVPNSEVDKLHVVFDGFFTMALTLIHKCSDLSTVAKYLEERLASIYKTIFGGSKNRKELCSLVVAYAESTKLILEKNSDFSLSQEKLFCPPLAQLVGVMHAAEKSTVFAAVNSALNNIKECSQVPHLLSDGRCLQLLVKLWNQYGAHLKYRPSVDDASRVSYVASSFAICCVRLSMVTDSEKSVLKSIAAELLSRFISNNSNGLEMSQNFVIEILNDEAFIKNAIRLFPDLEERIISYAISTLINCGQSGDMDELFVVIFRLPGIVTLVIDPSCHPFRAVEDLVIALAEKFNEAKDLKERLLAREKANNYLNSLENSVHSVVNKSPVPAHIHEIMGLVGELFLQGCQIFYLKGKPNCLLTSLINRVILPATIYSADKPLMKTVADAFRLLIPKVMTGLVTLNPSCDAYVQRCFRDIIIHYLYRFSPSEHPFLEFFALDKSHPMRTQFLEIIRDHFITKRKCPISHLNIVFEILLRLISSKQKEFVPLICTHVLLNVLDLLLILEELHAKFIHKFLRKLFHQDDLLGVYYRADILEGIRKFVSCQLKWSSKKVFAILMRICDMDSSLIADLMGKILTVICETEEKRGTGHDAVLRNGYSQLENKLKLS